MSGNSEIVFPDLKAAEKEVEAITYPGQKHCFGFFAVAERGVANDGDVAASRFFTDMDAFFKRHLPTQPDPLADLLVEKVVSSGNARERIERIERIELSLEFLADYVGTYDTPVGPVELGIEDVVVTLEDHQLMVETGFDRGPLFAASETEFFFDPPRSAPEFEFIRDDDGMATHVIVRPFNLVLSGFPNPFLLMQCLEFNDRHGLRSHC